MDISTTIQNFHVGDTDLNGPLFRHARRCQSQYRALRGGNHTGLSTWGAQEAWLHASRAHLNRRVPSHGNNGVGLVLGSLDAVVPCLRKTALPNIVEQDLLDRSERRIVLNNGNWIQFFSISQSGDTDHSLELASLVLAGYRFDWIWCDGIPDARILDEVMAHSYEDTPVWITFTPFAPPTSEHAVKSLKALRTRMEGDAKAKLPPREPWTQHVIPLSKWTCPWRSQYSINRQIETTPARDAAQRIYAMWEDTTEGSTQPSEWVFGGIDHGLPGASSSQAAFFTGMRRRVPPYSTRSQFGVALLMTAREDMWEAAASLGLAKEGDADIPSYQLPIDGQGQLTGNGVHPYADAIAKRAMEAGVEEQLLNALNAKRQSPKSPLKMISDPFADYRLGGSRVARHLSERYGRSAADTKNSLNISSEGDSQSVAPTDPPISQRIETGILEQLNQRFHTQCFKKLDPLFESGTTFIRTPEIAWVDEQAKPSTDRPFTIDRSPRGVMFGIVLAGFIPDGASVAGVVIREGRYTAALVRLEDGTEVQYSLGMASRLPEATP